MKYPPSYTWEDYQRWEGDWELIEGFPYAMSPSPKANHQNLGSGLNFVFRAALQDACEGCSVFYELDWIVNSQTIVRPDLFVACHPVLDYLRDTPSIVVEILSPSTVIIDKSLKMELYAEQGVPYYLIADPDKQHIFIYVLNNSKYEQSASFRTSDYTFNLGECDLHVNFRAAIWPKEASE